MQQQAKNWKALSRPISHPRAGRSSQLPRSPASSQQRKGEAAASKKRTVVQYLLEERVQHPSLLAEHRHPPAAAPTRTSLVLPKPSAATVCTAAIDCTSFNAEAAASGLQQRPADSLHQLDSRQPTHVELRAPISSFNSTSVLSPSVYHSHAETLSTCFQQDTSNLGNTCGHRCSNKCGCQELCFRYQA